MTELNHGGTITQLLARLKEGDDDAATDLWQRYFEQLTRLASRKLGNTPRQVKDEEDVALSALNCLLEGARRGKFPQLEDREDLWKLLVVITNQKAIDQIRWNNRQKRTSCSGESSVHAAGIGDTPCNMDQFAGTTPTPQFLLQLEEEHQRMLNELGDMTLRKIAIWKMEGDTIREIAAKLGVATSTVELKLALIRARWLRIADSWYE